MAATQLDIIIPSLSSAEDLGRCLSALDTWVPPMMSRHWIIVDDAGDDAVMEEARFFAATRSQITVIRNEKKLYYARSVNRALKRVRGMNHIVVAPGVQLEDKGAIDKLLHPFSVDPKAMLSVADCRMDWNSFRPWPIAKEAVRGHTPLAQDLWAITRNGYRMLGPLPEDADDHMALTRYVSRALGVVRAWMVPSVRTYTVPYLYPKNMPSAQELDKRARPEPTVLVEKR